jgi:hypothetical protein
MRTRSLALALASALCLLWAAAPLRAADTKKPGPDATMKLVSKSVAAGLGISWGTAKLHYQGKYYDVVVDGLTIGSVGVSAVTALGRIYHLAKLEDVDGHYVAVTAGATVGGGAEGLIMKNQNGVEIHVTATTQGVSLTMGAAGVKLFLKK